MQDKTVVYLTGQKQQKRLNGDYPRRARSALGVDTVLTLDVCLYVCMLVL